MHRVIPALLLAGCMAAPAPQAYRDTTAPISSIALFDAARLQGGEWREVASFRDDGACLICRAGFTPDGGGVKMVSGAGTAQLMPAGPGRLAPKGLDGALAQPWWVLWVDADYRTLVIGTPSGEFAAVLDRGEIGADRRKAAEEILRWAGYDVARLKPSRL